uniref:Uncharacterized protein n=1 Tax=Oryza rufipogon TaxID=4529 RepID=A0A0E0Q6Q8_ORYRU
MAPESSQPAKKRRTYRCRRCGFPKKGHVCVDAAAAGGVLPLLPSPEEEEKFGRISALPENVLHTIISLLPTIGGAKTQLAEGLFVPDIHNGLIDDAAAIECLDLHLKEIVRARGDDISSRCEIEQKVAVESANSISLEGKASPNARFEFSRDDYFMDYYYNHSQRTHQLSVGDPIDD